MQKKMCIKENNVMFVHKILRAIGDCFLKTFLPLVIYKMTNNLNYAIIFVIIETAMVALLNQLLKKNLTANPILATILSFIPIIAIQIVVAFCELNIYIIILLAILLTLSQVLYAVPINLIFAVLDKNYDVSKMQIGSNIGIFMFTILTGFIIDANDKTMFILWLFVGIFFYVMSLIPLFSQYKNILFKVKNLSFKSDVKNTRFDFINAIFGVFQLLMDTIIPLYLFSKGLNFTTIALIKSAVELSKIGTNLWAKHLHKKKFSVISVYVASIIYAICAMGIFFFTNNIVLIVLSSFISIIFPFINVPLLSVYCKKLEAEDEMRYGIARRDICIFTSRPILTSTYYLGCDFLFTFIFATLATLIMPVLYMQEEKLLANNEIKNEGKEI